MGLTAAIVGAIGGLCAVMGIVTAAEIVPLVLSQFTWNFWFSLAAIFLLGAIAFGLGRGYE
jgi:hypothetical protein